MVKTVDAGGPDIHAGTLPHRFKTFQYLNILG
jgi:hypothetical protein